MIYKGVYISRNQYSYYTAWLDCAGMYCQSETLEGCKRMINDDLNRRIVCK